MIAANPTTTRSARLEDEPDDEVVNIGGAVVALEALIVRVATTGAPIVLARDAEPQAVLISAADLAELRGLRDADRRRAALAELERLHAELGESNRGVSDEDAEEFGRRMGKEVNRVMAQTHLRQADDRRRTD